MTLLAKIARRGPADLLLAAEALALLVFFRVCLAAVPVRRIIGTMTRGHAKADDREAEAKGSADSPPSVAIAGRVRWAVSAAARHSVLEFVCFPQTLAGYTMLRRRGVASTMVYGVARSPGGELQAHTWLTVGDRTVLGGEEAAEFTAVERWT
jgi:hypothetical protein